MDEQCYNLRIGTLIKQNWIPRRRAGKRRRPSESDTQGSDSEADNRPETPSRLVQSLIDPVITHSAASHRQLYFSPKRRFQIATESSSEASHSGKIAQARKLTKKNTIALKRLLNQLTKK